ncbi:MAG: SDR family oxidoreductase [Inquilinaceae bacterium]
MTGVLLVTGGSRGIGAAVARMAGQRGYDVCVNYRADRHAAEAVVADIEAAGRKAIAVAADVVDQASVTAMFDEAEAKLGPLTALVNSAGILNRAARLDTVDLAEARRVLDVNVFGLLLCAREGVLRMSTRHGRKGGAIVNISSKAAVLGGVGESLPYAASKGAVDTFTFGLGREVAGEGIRVNAIRPGLIDTDMQLASGIENRLAKLTPSIPIGRAGTADDVAEAVLWLLSDGARYVTGTVFDVSGGR